ncbi:MAG: hypothetical protein HYZ73_05125 [Elusimicrobia bacterium]|nr:hypothetical protein [Elusimicrobiota bacterium]
MVKDERLDREFLGPGVRTTFGARLLGVFAFGLISFAVPGEPTFQETDLVGIFQKAFEERFRANGVPVASGSTGENFYQQHAVVEGGGSSDPVTLEVLVRHLMLDFNFGKWIGEAGYVLRMKKGQELLCEDSISERVTRMNVWGFGSGERVISEAFAKAVNRANLSACLSRLEE